MVVIGGLDLPHGSPFRSRCEGVKPRARRQLKVDRGNKVNA